MGKKKNSIEIPRSLYDAIGAVAKASGGIGRFARLEYGGESAGYEPVAPVCLWGHIEATGIELPDGQDWGDSYPKPGPAFAETADDLSPEARAILPIGGIEADEAVRRVAARRKAAGKVSATCIDYDYDRVPWAELARELNIVPV